MSNRSDNFTRANSTTSLGSPSDGGSAWVVTGTWGIFGNAAYKVATGGATEVARLEAGSSIGTVQAVVNTVNGKFPGLVIAYVDDSNFIFGQVETTFLKCWRVLLGSFSQLGSTFNGTITNGETISVSRTSLGAIAVLQNGVSRVTASDGNFLSATKVGMCSFETGTNNTWDDFLFTDAAAAGFQAAWAHGSNAVVFGSGARGR